MTILTSIPRTIVGRAMRPFQIIAVAWLLSASVTWAQDKIDADVLFTSARIFDGVNPQPTLGDVAIKDDRIVAVGKFETGSVGWRIDCTGLTLTPGFIDLHNHSDGYITKRATRSATNFLTQGCTTLVTGNCGSGPIDMLGFEKRIKGAGVGPNIAHLIPQGTLRREVVGEDNRKATTDEIRRMRALAALAMNNGAWGMSTGLIYVPGSFTPTDELIAIAEIVGEHNGIYASHMRSEGKNVLVAVDEAMRIGRDADVPVHISHFKSVGRDSWGLVREAIRVIEKNRAAGMRITADQYPYIASSTSLRATLVPGWARAGGKSEMVRRLNDPDKSQRVRDAIQKSLERKDNGSRVQIARHRNQPDWAGKRISQIAKLEDTTPLEVVVQILKNGGASVVNFSMQEEDVRHVMQVPWVATASDGRAYLPGGDRPHPRNYGTFPRKLGFYALREKTITEAQAIRSCTTLPAEILGMSDRGRIQTGFAADITIYDPKTIIDNSTFEQPHQHSTGIRHVFVNGSAVVFDGTPTGNRPGKLLKRPTPSNRERAGRR
ncbi:MAG: amidohydrolase family protein [Planctomycetaceae bacterium]